MWPVPETWIYRGMIQQKLATSWPPEARQMSMGDTALMGAGQCRMLGTGRSEQHGWALPWGRCCNGCRKSIPAQYLQCFQFFRRIWSSGFVGALVPLGRYNKTTTDWRAGTTDLSFSLFWKVRIKIPVDSLSGESPAPVAEAVVFSRGPQVA